MSAHSTQQAVIVAQTALCFTRFCDPQHERPFWAGCRQTLSPFEGQPMLKQSCQAHCQWGKHRIVVAIGFSLLLVNQPSPHVLCCEQPCRGGNGGQGNSVDPLGVGPSQTAQDAERNEAEQASSPELADRLQAAHTQLQAAGNQAEDDC